MVVDTLVKILDQISLSEVNIGFTDQLADVVENFDWNVRDDYAVLYEIHRLLHQLVLHPFGVVRIDVSDVTTYHSHPVPEGCQDLGLIEIWCDEMGRLLARHDQCCRNGKFFIGIACESAYVRGTPRVLINPEQLRSFPLIGPTNISSLDDAYEWVVQPEIRNRNVPFGSVLRNYGIIGSHNLVRPSGSSHYQLKFKGGRTWPLDANIDPVPDTFLRELVPITGFPFDVLKYALLFGDLPERRFRIRN